MEKVEPQSPAARAGMRGGYIPANFGGIELLMGGDLIVKVGEHDLEDSGAVHAFLVGLKPGDTIPYTVLRAGRFVPVNVTVDKIVAIPRLGEQAGSPAVQ